MKLKFQSEKTQKYVFFIISLFLKCSTNITVVDMLNCFQSFPHSFTINSLNPGSPIQEKLAFMAIASLTFYKSHLLCTSMLISFSTLIQKCGKKHSKIKQTDEEMKHK